MMVPQRKTVDGFEEHFGLNYLGHFLLTRLLLDSLSQSGRAGRSTRVVTVSSATHYVAELALDDLQSRCVRARHGPGRVPCGARWLLPTLARLCLCLPSSASDKDGAVTGSRATWSRTTPLSSVSGRLFLYMIKRRALSSIILFRKRLSWGDETM